MVACAFVPTVTSARPNTLTGAVPVTTWRMWIGLAICAHRLGDLRAGRNLDHDAFVQRRGIEREDCVILVRVDLREECRHVRATLQRIAQRPDREPFLDRLEIGQFRNESTIDEGDFARADLREHG